MNRQTLFFTFFCCITACVYAASAVPVRQLMDEGKYKEAADRGHAEAFPYVIQTSIDNYAPDEAREYIEKWRSALKKAKKPEPEDIADLEERVLLLANQMNRIEDIPVIARYDVSVDDFNNAVKSANGSVNQGLQFINNTIPFYLNSNSRQVFWTEPDTKGVHRLFMAGLLDDGSRDEAIDLTQYVGDGDIMAPFMMEDGETLYFAANKDKDGLGGYDIFMTRADGDGGFYEPSNVGMPYNSPANDMLYVIDENNNIGWWATDRFTGADSVSIMVFVPNANRKNLEVDDEEKPSRAKIDDIAMTIPDGFAIDAARAKIPQPTTVGIINKDSDPPFAISLGDGRIITSYEQLTNHDSVDAVNDILEARDFMNDIETQLTALRLTYAKGNKNVKNDILQLETELERQRNYIKTYTNRLIRLESVSR